MQLKVVLRWKPDPLCALSPSVVKNSLFRADQFAILGINHRGGEGTEREQIKKPPQLRIDRLVYIFFEGIQLGLQGESCGAEGLAGGGDPDSKVLHAEGFHF